MANNYFRRRAERHSRKHHTEGGDNNHQTRERDDDEDFDEWRAKWRHTLMILGIIGAVGTTVLGWIVSIFSLIKDYTTWHK
jgi:hypothetical protein